MAVMNPAVAVGAGMAGEPTSGDRGKEVMPETST
jgi:hypothetical protein